MIFVWVFWPRNYVSMRKWGPRCIQSVPRGIIEPSKCAPRSFGTMQRVPRFLLRHSYGAKINMKLLVFFG